MPKKKSLFKKSLLIYTIVLFILACVFLIFVYGNLKKYEKNLLEPLLLNTIHNLDKKELQGYLEQANQNTNLLATYQEMTKRDDYKFVGTNDTNYDAYLDGRVLFTIKLKSLGETSCLGLLQYEKFEVEGIVPHLENGLIYYEVKIPSNYKLLVDGNVYDKVTKEEEMPNLDFMYYNDAMPKMVTYEIKDLERPATIEVENFNGEKVILKQEGVHYTYEETMKLATLEKAKPFIGDLDIETIAKNWSLFLSQDLSGGNYGFQTFKKYLVEGTDMYKQAYNWAHNIDITFTSKHTLKNPPFTNERIENFVIYGDSAFSCEVYLEKNMVVKGQNQTDAMHDTLSFIKVDGEWKLMNIKGIKDGASKNE